GIYGQQGVAAAAYWPLFSNETYSMAAFEAFRNYDGQGACFGDTSASATSSDPSTATVYASMNQADHNHVVIIAINKATTTKTAAIKVTAETVFKSVKVYTVTNGNPSPQAAGKITTAAQNAFQYTMPAQSISIIVPGS